MEYTYLTKEDQEAMVVARLRNYEAEHYQTVLAIQAAESLVAKLPDDPPLPEGVLGPKAQALAQAEQMDAAKALIENAHEEAAKELVSLDNGAVVVAKAKKR